MSKLLQFILLTLLGLCWAICTLAVQLRTRSVLRGKYDARFVHAFLSTPENWPSIVASSVRCEGIKGMDQMTTDIGVILRKGGQVKEIFGLPPLIPLEVVWNCEECTLEDSVYRLNMHSRTGLKNVAKDCRMLFEVRDVPKDGGSVEVGLEMSYEPISPIARLAVPILLADNALALKFLLPNVLQNLGISKLDQFRQIMAMLYCGAGLLHFSDLILGNSLLFTQAGAPQFGDLPALGQVYALAWCVSGPLALYLSRQHKKGDIALIQYGIVEVMGSLLIGANVANGIVVILNAIGVQTAVIGSWFYCQNLDDKATETGTEKEKNR